MGDYSLGHFNFALKRGAPKDIKTKLEQLQKGDGFKIGEERIYLGSSAYHHEETYFLSEPPVGYGYEEPGEDTRYSMTFQIKYGCGQLRAFAEWLAPHVVVDRSNLGFIGYSISEYANTVTAFVVDAAGKLRDAWKSSEDT